MYIDSMESDFAEDHRYHLFNLLADEHIGNSNDTTECFPLFLWYLQFLFQHVSQQMLNVIKTILKLFRRVIFYVELSIFYRLNKWYKLLYEKCINLDNPQQLKLLKNIEYLSQDKHLGKDLMVCFVSLLVYP